jgi:hypothetical protein
MSQTAGLSRLGSEEADKRISVETTYERPAEQGLVPSPAIEGWRWPMMTPDEPRRRVSVLGFLLAMVLLPIGAVLAPLGVGIPIFAIGLALILPDS